MELRDYIRIIFRRLWIIIIAAVAGVLATIFLSSRAVTVYQAQTLIRLSTVVVGDGTWIDYNIQYADRFTNTFAQVFQIESVQNELRTLLNVETLPDYEVEVQPNTELLTIRTRSTDAYLAMNGANALGGLMVSEADELLGLDASANVNATVHIIEPAEFAIPTGMPNRAVQLGIGAAAGALAGVLMTLVAHSADRRIYSSADLHDSEDMPLLAQVRARRGGLRQAMTMRAQDVRRAASRIHKELEHEGNLSHDRKPTAVMFVSAGDEDFARLSKEIAETLATDGKTILLIDTGLRKPTSEAMLGVTRPANGEPYGLAAILEREVCLDDALLTASPLLYVLPVGSARSSDALLEKMHDFQERVLQPAYRMFDLIILHTPGYLASAYATQLALAVGHAIIVADAGRTKQPTLDELQWQLRADELKVLGLILNNAP